MELNGIFLNPVSRPIEGVIKADDESSLYEELSEYVLTNEVAKRLEHFLDAYIAYQGANGVWVSGFFGSGKSHLLKMLALLLENRVIDGRTALDIFLPKIHPDDELLRAKLKKAVLIASKSILFNIDQKADIISKSQVDALLSVFVKVFNEMCGYYGKQGYIADNVKLMTNLQTVAESLATKCDGRARIIVTAQEEMSSVLGDLSKQQSNDFTKIQARFANRLKLTSADVAEVIQKRLLTKNPIGIELLQTTYSQQVNNFKTLFDFADGGAHYSNFRDEAHFVDCYPFVPYQFPLFQSAIRGLSLHNGFEGKANSVGERSMLGVFREVAMAIDREPVGQLATFDRMFEGIRGVLKSGIQSAINTAERHLGDPYAVRVLKALFLVKYVKEFKATPRNLGILMLERFGEDLPAQRKRLEAALNLLEQQTYIQRSGDLYEYLTDEEKDIEEEIKNTEVEAADVVKELETLLFDGVIKQRKIRYGNGQDYPFTRKLDDKALGREQELAIHIVTPLSDHFDNLPLQRMHSMGRDELRVVLPADARFMQDLTMHKRTEKYIRQNSNTQQEAIKRILDGKGFRNAERLAELQERAKVLLGRAHLIINAGDVDVGGEDGQARIIKGFHQLIATTYPNLRMLRDVPFNEADIGKHLRQSQDGLLANDATSLTEAEQELLAFIQSNARGGVRTTVKSLLERFERKNYGWYYAAILCNLALLCARGKVEVRQDSNPLDGETLERALRNTGIHAGLILEPQIEFTAAQVRALKDFFADFFDRPATGNEARALARETIDAVKDLEIALVELQAKQEQYPFLGALDAVLATLKTLAENNAAWFLTDLARAEDALLDTKEQVIEPLRRFMKSPQKDIFDQTHTLVTQEEDNFPYVDDADVDAIKTLLTDAQPWQGNRLQQAKPRIEALQQAIANQLATEKTAAASRLDELEQRLQGMAEYGALTTEQRTQITAPFQTLRQALSGQKRIAMVRDQLRRFEDHGYQQVLLRLEKLTRPPAAPTQPDTSDRDRKPGGGYTPAPEPTDQGIGEIKLIPAGSIKVGYPRPWLASEAELDDYLRRQREAWLKEIQAGNRVQI